MSYYFLEEGFIIVGVGDCYDFVVCESVGFDDWRVFDVFLWWSDDFIGWGGCS